MQTTVKVMPTYWKGFEFRSRTEARWAVFLSEMRVEWQYEPDGFMTDEGPYLPDFWLPGIGAFLEVKCNNYTEQAAKKAAALATFTRKRVLVFDGPPHLPCENEGTGGTCYFPDWVEDEHYLWCQCLKCGKVGIEFDGRADRICGKDHAMSANGDKGHNFETPQIIAAVMAARGERFGT